jgi:hypothetical protein
MVKRADAGPRIACNEALMDNLFMMVVCVSLRIPLFLVGKPGSSKSLARQIICNAMNGPYSKDELFQSLPQVENGNKLQCGMVYRLLHVMSRCSQEQFFCNECGHECYNPGEISR